MDGLFGDGLVDVLCCGGDSLEEDLRWGPRLGAVVDLVEFEDGVTNGGVALFKIVEALSGGAFFFSTSVELKTEGAGGGGAGREMIDSNTSLPAILTPKHQACVNTVFVHKLKQEGIEIALLVSHWLIFLTNQQTKVLAPNYNPK